MSRTFASLAIRNYRLFFCGAIVSNIGTWMGRVAQDWLVLTQLTAHSSTALGTVTSLQFLPFLLFAPWTGVVADRFPKRRILLITQSVMALGFGLNAVLVINGTVQLWMVYLLALLTGCATAFDNPARQAFVSEMVGQDNVANAVGLNSASFNFGRLVGPGAAGLVIAWVGVGPAMAFNGISFAFVLAALLLMDPRKLMPAPLATGRGRLREGLAYVRGRPDLLVILFLVFVLGTFGMNFQIANAVMATKEFGKGPTEYGVLGSVMAIGSLSAALMTARRRRPQMRLLFVSLAGFTVTTLALALAPGYVLFAVLLVPVGLCAMTAMTVANTMAQLTVDPAMRGRVMGLYMTIFIGGTPIGSPIVGWVGDTLGPRWTILVGTIGVGLALAAVAIRLTRHDNLRVKIDLHEQGWLRVTRPEPPLPVAEAEVVR